MALWIIDAPFGGFNVAFFVAMMLALAGADAGPGVMMSPPLTATLHHDQAKHPESWWRDIIGVFDRNVLLAATLLFTSHLSLSCFTSFGVLYAHKLSISHFGWFFIVTGVISVLARPLLGRLSDKIGCGNSLIAAFILESVALLIPPFVTSLSGMMAAGRQRIGLA